MMKKVLLVVLTFLLALLLVACGGNAEVDKDDPLADIKARGILRVGVKNDVPGFGLLNPANDEYEGMEIDLANMIAYEIFGEEGHVQLTPVTAETRGILLENEQIDLVIATFTIKPERLEKFNFSEPYYTDSVGLLVETKSGIADISMLDGKKVGVSAGSTSKDALAEYAPGMDIKFIEYSNYPDISGALSEGLIDAFCVDRSILNGYNTEDREILPDTFSPQEYGIASAKSNKALAEFVDNFVKNLKAGDRYGLLLEKNGL